MKRALVFNPGSNSLKFELVECAEGQAVAGDATKLVSATLEDFGKDARFTASRGHEVEKSERCEVGDMKAATGFAVKWLREQGAVGDALNDLSLLGVRVVHGGSIYAGATRVDAKVRADIEAFEDLAPLHNKNSIEILDVLASELPGTAAYVTFDTAFHRSLPEEAWRYPIESEVADRHGVRKFGFHGLSHRYMVEQYAKAVGNQVQEVTAVTLHLESGCSATAIRNGRSVDTTMGMTPLEGLMMGSRSGSIDPAILPYLMKKEGKSADEVLALLNRRSGLIGIAGGSLDTRELVKRGDEAAKLALRMFSYRVRLAVGAYLAALGNADAVLFGGGIGENSPWLRTAVCEGLGGWGLELDAELNKSIGGQVRVSKVGSRLEAWAMPVEEGLQMAHECFLAMGDER